MNEKNASQAAEILARLKKGPALSTELNGIGYRYSARIHELRQAGVAISTSRVANRLYEYRLVGV